MPLSQHDWLHLGNFLLHDELDYHVDELADAVAQFSQSFNQEQTLAFDSIMLSVTENQGKSFFIHSAGGGGKTYLCNAIAAAVHSRGKAALCVASSGIAALLLDGVALHTHASKFPSTPMRPLCAA